MPFRWDKEFEQPLIEDNTKEPTLAPLPNIPAKMPGVDLEHNMPAMSNKPAVIEEPKLTTKEQPTAAAAANANIRPRENRILNFSNIAGVEWLNRPVYNINNHFNLVSTECDDVEALVQEDKDDAMP